MISIEDNIRVNPDHERLFYRNNVGKIGVIFNQKKQTSLEKGLLFVICDPVGSSNLVDWQGVTFGVYRIGR